MDAKILLMSLLRRQRKEAQERVNKERNAFRRSLIEIDHDEHELPQNQNDPMYLDGLSSDFERVMSVEPDDSAGDGSETETESETEPETE